MQQGALSGSVNDKPDGCFYGYAGENGDGSETSGPIISASASEKSSLQIKASNKGERLMFRVKDITTGEWSSWKELQLK